jgi:integrase
LPTGKAHFGGVRLQEGAQHAPDHAGAARLRAAHTCRGERCLSTLRLAFGWFVEMHYIDRNPFAELTNRIAGGEEDSRAQLSDDEIRILWALDSPNANLLRALLLTGCRIAELQKASTPHLLTGAAEIKDF